MASWNHIEVGPGGKISVFLGRNGDKTRGFVCFTSVQHEDIVTLFGSKLIFLDMTDQKIEGSNQCSLL